MRRYRRHDEKCFSRTISVVLTTVELMMKNTCESRYVPALVELNEASCEGEEGRGSAMKFKTRSLRVMLAAR